MDEKLLEAILVQLAQFSKKQDFLIERVDRFLVDLNEFSERFEEIVQGMEAERRLDLYGE